MDLDTERSNRLLNLFTVSFIVAFIAGFALGAVAMWVFLTIK